MRIFFAGSQGQELKNKRLFELITSRRLLSYYYMTSNLNEGYFKKTHEKETEDEER